MWGPGLTRGLFVFERGGGESTSGTEQTSQADKTTDFGIADVSRFIVFRR